MICNWQDLFNRTGRHSRMRPDHCIVKKSAQCTRGKRLQQADEKKPGERLVPALFIDPLFF